MEQTSAWPDIASPDVAGIRAFMFGSFRLNLTERSLQQHGVPVPLGGWAFDILALLVQRAGQVVRHDELIAHVWADVRVSPGTPRVHLTAVRKVLGCRPDRTRYIANVPGRGYCFVAPGVTAVASERQNGDKSAHLVPLGLTASADASINSEPPSLSKSGAAASPFRTKRDLQAQQMALNVAEQLLATPNTDHVLISGKFRSDPEVNLRFGGNSERGASMTNASPGAVDLRLMAEGEGTDMDRKKLAIAAAITLLTCVADAGFSAARAETPLRTAGQVTHYRTTTIDGVSLFYREAGPSNGPVVVLLHGFPTSSHMFRNLIPALADRYHVIAPDYPGFGQSAAPDHTQFAYTFAHYASLVDALLQQLGAKRYAMYVMDYGAPVGYRLALLHPELAWCTDRAVVLMRWVT